MVFDGIVDILSSHYLESRVANELLKIEKRELGAKLQQTQESFDSTLKELEVFDCEPNEKL